MSWVLVLALAAGCGGQASRVLPDADVTTDADGEPDAGADADVDSDAVRCTLSDPPITIYGSDEPFAVSTLNALPVGHFVLAGTTTRSGLKRAVVWIVRGSDLGLAGQTELDLESIVAGYDILHDDVIAVGRAGDEMSFLRMSIGWDWVVSVDSARPLCTGCEASTSSPIHGPLLALVALADPARGAVRISLVPHDDVSPVVESEWSSGTAPVVVEGPFGPILFHQRASGGPLDATTFHWNGEVVEEVENVVSGDVESYAAASDRGREVFLVTTLEVMGDHTMFATRLDDALEPHLDNLIEAGEQGFVNPAIAIGDETAAIAWLELFPDGQSEPRAMIVARDDLSVVHGSVGFDRPCFRTTGDGPGIVVAASDQGYAIIWDACPDDAPVRLQGVLVECTSAR